MEIMEKKTGVDEGTTLLTMLHLSSASFAQAQNLKHLNGSQVSPCQLYIHNCLNLTDIHYSHAKNNKILSEARYRILHCV